MTVQRPDRLETGVTYMPATVGPYLWHEFHAESVVRDLTAIAARRIGVVRILLSWDAFMPTDRGPSPRRMSELEALLTAARALGLGVVLGLFVQSIGDCVMLPAYAVDRRRPRQGVRCLTDARVVDGGPRDVYADPLMLEVQVRWLDALLAAFAGHPAIVAWDLGHDPATTVRPRRIAEMAAWAELLGGRIHAQDERCRLTLGQGDVVTGRGVRMAALGEHVDAIGLVLRPQRLALPGDGLAPDRAVFTVALAQALSGTDVPLLVDVGFASADDRAAEEHGAVDQTLERLVDAGVTGVFAAAWSDWGERLLEAPPADRDSSLARLGIVDSVGDSKPVAPAWHALSAERAVVRASPFPSTLDADSYYANLPDSLLDLYASWQGVQGDVPAILG